MSWRAQFCPWCAVGVPIDQNNEHYRLLTDEGAMERKHVIEACLAPSAEEYIEQLEAKIERLRKVLVHEVLAANWRELAPGENSPE